MGGVRGVPHPVQLSTTKPLTKGLAALFNKGNRRYFVVAVTAFAGLVASLGAGWFDGS